MEKFKSMLKPKPNPQEQLRDWQRRLRQECRNIERQIRGNALYLIILILHIFHDKSQFFFSFCKFLLLGFFQLVKICICFACFFIFLTWVLFDYTLKKIWCLFLDVQREEKGVQKAIREAAKRNDMGSAKVL